MANLKILAYSDIYKQDVIKLIVDIQKKEFGVPITIEEQPDLNDIPAFYQTNNGNFWVATFDDSIAGTIGLLDIGNSHGALRKMFVDEKYRGKTYLVGQTLLHTLIAWAKRTNFSELFLGTTDKFKAAQRFYEKNGFVEIKKRSLPEHFPVMPVDTKFYTYNVQNL